MNDHVFICYSRKDENFVLKLATGLKDRGVPVWVDQWDIPSGANWNRTIEKALNECARLLLVLSPSSVESDEVQCEWLSALDEKKFVVPILYQPCHIPFRLKPIQYIDFTSRSSDDETSLEQILKTMGIVGSTLIKPITQPEKPPESFELLNGPKLDLKMQGSDYEVVLTRERDAQLKPKNQNISIPTRLAKSQTKVEKSNVGTIKTVAFGSFIAIAGFLIWSIVIAPNLETEMFWNEKGIALYNQAKYDEALQAFDKAIKIGSFEEFWYNKGKTLQKLGRTSEAQAAFDRAKKKEPLYPNWIVK